jgi:rsbT antagonist protein RsbS
MNIPRSIPLIRLYGNLIVPIQLELSEDIMARLTSDVTSAIERSSVSGLIIDLTGVGYMDSFITRCIRDLAVTARVMGVSTVMCGLSWVVVVTLVEMGLSIPGVRSALNLEQALTMLAPRDAFGAPDRSVALQVVRHSSTRVG